uniref:Uncharacterized protein n=1 Tax=Timema douglasi TaxID=61478 RepID=A0A7R8VM32_TIMDO|nr:unnamed protein product [Timema douglasi]
MAEKIKKFFQKKKADAKFKMAGPGYKLNAAVPQPKVEASSTTKVTPRGPLSDEAKQAAAAALARLGGQKQGTAAFNTSLAAIQAQVCRELEAEKKESLIEEVPKSGVDSSPGDDENLSPFLAVNGVYFKCPLIAGLNLQGKVGMVSMGVGIFIIEARLGFSPINGTLIC